MLMPSRERFELSEAIERLERLERLNQAEGRTPGGN